MQDRDTESEAEQKPPDSSGLSVIRLKGLPNGMGTGIGSAFWCKKECRREERRGYAYETARQKDANESLECCSQSYNFLFSQFLRFI